MSVCVFSYFSFSLFRSSLKKHMDKSSIHSKVSFFIPLVLSPFVCCINVHINQGCFWLQSQDEEASMDPFLRNSLLFRKKMFGSMLDPHRKPGVVCHLGAATVSATLLFQVVWRCSFSFQVRTGYDGLGGRTKYIQPVSLTSSCRINSFISNCFLVILSLVA